MKFVVEVDVDKLAGEPVDELGRALRFWAGNLKHYDLTRPQTETITDSAYHPVGTWSLS